MLVFSFTFLLILGKMYQEKKKKEKKEEKEK